jgi:subtilisin family serine protease
MSFRYVRSGWAAAVLSVVLAPSLPFPAAAAARGTPAVRPAPPPGQPPAASVTLVTGDRVLVDGAGSVSVRPAAGRRGISFTSTVEKGHRYVVPSDAQGPVRAGVVDRRLFDVTALVDFRYDDAHTGSVPLIIQQGRVPAALRSVRGLTVGSARLGVPGTMAAHVAKADAASVWQRVTAGSLAGGRLWLDGRRKLSLDRSVPQIGAPAAWKAGYTGTGVKVAVVDSGVDASHPDLVGQVVAEKNFSDDPGPGDAVGHGTHVASTIASSGANLHGKYTGVAPGAKLLDAKVCDKYSCADSAILAGMQWAVDEGAKIVNLSLGSWDMPGLDPLEEAVDTLSAQHGTLFVVAAGNDAPYGSVSSPGSADAALTVGAVDRDDIIAPFSSRGPRHGGGTIKPDIAAPGVGIVAAQATGSTIGTPGPDPGYQVLSGTSMATPHVAGSAALLAQEHPDWSGQRLKAALMGSAKPTPKQFVFDEGAGRVDVGRAVGLNVTAQPPSVSFGEARWPHSDDVPQRTTLAYVNSGDKPVTLRFSADASGPDGRAAADGFFSVDPPTVTVPAGGRTEVAVVADTRVGTTDGLFQGAVVATADDGSTVRTPVVAQREPESYDVHLTYLDEAGNPTDRHIDSLNRLTDFDGGFYDGPGSDDGKATVRLQRGEYMLWTSFFSTTGKAVVVTPSLQVDHELDLSVDARVAKPIAVTVPEDPAAKEFGGSFEIHRGAPAGFGPSELEIFPGGFTQTGHQVLVGQNAPRAAPGSIQFSVNDLWISDSGDATKAVLYSLGWDQAGVPDGFTRAMERRSLARLEEDLPPSDDRLIYRQNFGSTLRTANQLSTIWFTPDITGARHVTTYVTTAAQHARWGFLYWYIVPGWDTREFMAVPFRVYRAGQVVRRHDGYPVFGPVLSDAYEPGDAWRIGDQANLNPGMFGDSAGNRGTFPLASSTASFTRVDRPGTVPTDQYGFYVMAPEAGVYRYDTTATRSSGDLSTTVSGSWTFHSGRTAQPSGAGLPLSAIRFTPRLTPSGDAPAGRLFTVPVAAQRMAGSPAGRIDRIRVEVSYDDGVTWTRVPVFLGRALLWHPDRAGYVSLRGSGTDDRGNSVTVTIVHAYRLAPS